MRNTKRILKTGALAVAVTIGFAIFAYRAAEWSKGLNSGVMVFGQSTNTGGGGNGSCSTPSTGTNTIQVTKIIPQLAIGSFDNGLTKYVTVVQIVNTSGTAQTINANFYKEDGTALDNVTLSAGTSNVSTGVLPATSIPKDGIFVISSSTTPKIPGVIGWARIATCGGVSISTFFELRDASSNVLYSRVGVAASPANMSSFVIPRTREVTSGLDVGFAIVNTASTGSAVLRAELRDASGNTVAVRDLDFPAGTHQAVFTKDLLSAANEPAGRTYQYIKFSSSSSSFAAIALAFEGATQTSFPVDVLQ